MDEKNNYKGPRLYTREEVMNMTPLQRKLFRIRTRAIVFYYSRKAWVFLQLIRLFGLFDPEMKKEYVVAEYRYRKFKDR